MSRVGEPLKKLVITADGFGYERRDGVSVQPITALGSLKVQIAGPLVLAAAGGLSPTEAAAASEATVRPHWKGCVEAVADLEVRSARALMFGFGAGADASRANLYHGCMSRRDDVLVKHRAEIEDAGRRHHAMSVALVGSVARGEDAADSDIDFLVDFEPGRGTEDVFNLQAELAAILGASVDVAPRSRLRGSCRTMYADAVPVLGDAPVDPEEGEPVPRRDDERIEDVKQACRWAAEIVADGRDAYDAGWRNRELAVHLLSRIGEALNHLAEDALENDPRVPVPQIVSMRNRLQHEYWDTDYDYVWDTVVHDAADLLAAMEAAAARLPTTLTEAEQEAMDPLDG